MASVMPNSIRLHYFNARSRGELIRYILYYAKVPFVDNRIERATWAPIKPRFPLGQVPVLEYQDAAGTLRVMTQSSAIARTCARWFGLIGKTQAETSTADEVHECMRDIGDAGSRITWEPDLAKKEQLMGQIKTETLPRMLTYLEKKMSNGEKYIAGGDSFTCADFAIAITLDHMSKDILVVPNVGFRSCIIDLKSLEKEFPNILALKKRVEEAPPIQKYLASRPETSF